MKSRIVMCITATTLFAAMAIAVRLRLAAQEAPAAQVQATVHTRYKLVDIGTLGGPASYMSEDADQSLILNNHGMVAGAGDTSEPDPYVPNCFQPDCFVSHVFRWQNGALTDLGALPGANSSAVGAMNERGWIVGFSENGEIDPVAGFPEVRAVLWKGTQIIDLGTLGGHESNAAYVSNGGQVIGFSTINVSPDPFSFVGTPLHTFLWENGVMRDLGTLGGPDALPGLSCTNEREGLVAGASLTDSIPNASTGFPTQHAFLWRNGTMTDIPTLGGTFAGAQCANNLGQVIGQSNLAGDIDQHAFFWEGGTLTDLGTLGGSFSIALWLSNEGEAVGGATTEGDTSFHATLWRNRVITDLGTLDGDCSSVANAVNSKGQTIGQSFSCDGSVSRAVLWGKGSIIDLNAAIPPSSTLQLTETFNINDRGEIVGRGLPAGCDNHDTCGHLFLLIPCDEAGTQGCEGLAELTTAATPINPAPVARATQAPSTATENRPTPSEMVASFRARLARRYHVPGALTRPAD